MYLFLMQVCIHNTIGLFYQKAIKNKVFIAFS